MVFITPFVGSLLLGRFFFFVGELEVWEREMKWISEGF